MKQTAWIRCCSASPSFGPGRGPQAPPNRRRAAATADTAHAVLAETPAVQAALAAREAARARGEALDAGPYEFELNAVGQRRDVRHEGDYTEWEAGISRRLRLPGKAALDRELGGLGNEVAELGIADAFHGAALELLDGWFGWLDAASAVAAAASARDALAEERAAVDKRLARGDAARLDLDLAESALAGAEAALAEARTAAAERSAALGARYPRLALPAAPPPIPDPAAPAMDAAALAAQIVARSHEIGIAEGRYQAVHEARRARRARPPAGPGARHPHPVRTRRRRDRRRPDLERPHRRPLPSGRGARAGRRCRRRRGRARRRAPAGRGRCPQRHRPHAGQPRHLAPPGRNDTDCPTIRAGGCLSAPGAGAGTGSPRGWR